MTLLDNISIILVRTKTPANIGAVARCMMNMGLSRLLLVRPTDHLTDEARKLAAGAEAILEAAAVHPTLADAVVDHHLVIGTSRHAGKQRKNIDTARSAASRIVPLLGRNRVALVFGREVNGLDNEDIALCHELITIPSAEAFPSLNLSHSVMVVAYELFLAACAGLPRADAELAPAQDMESLYEHLRRTLHAIGFLDEARSDHMMFSLRQIFGRARLTGRDVSILRGILSEMDRASGPSQA